MIPPAVEGLDGVVGAVVVVVEIVVAVGVDMAKGKGGWAGGYVLEGLFLRETGRGGKVAGRGYERKQKRKAGAGKQSGKARGGGWGGGTQDKTTQRVGKKEVRGAAQIWMDWMRVVGRFNVTGTRLKTVRRRIG